MNASTKKSLITLALIATAALDAQSAFADPAASAPSAKDPLSKQVSYDDLDITRPAGVAVLYTRIKAAADVVCSQYTGVPVRRMQMRNACMEQAIANAVTAVNEPKLTAYHEARHAKPSQSAVLAAGR